MLITKFSKVNSIHGSIKINFDLLKNKDIFIDYKGHVKNVTINGKEINVIHTNDRIYISSNYLSTKNVLIVNFISQYAENGLGLVKSDSDSEV